MPRSLIWILLTTALWMSACATSQSAQDCNCPCAEKDTAVAEVEQEKPELPDGYVDSEILPVGDSPMLGNPGAPITVVMFTDLQCPFCQRGAETMHQLVDEYPEKVRVVFKHNPLPMHEQAMDAHKAAIAAGKQGKFWEMHDWLFSNQKEMRNHENDFKQWASAQAKALGLDIARFERDFEAASTEARIDQDLQLSKAVQVRGTPHFFVNGERVRGAKPLAAFIVAVDEQLEAADAALAKSDVNEDNLYAHMVEQELPKDLRERRDREREFERKRARKKKPDTKIEFVPVEADDPMRGNTRDPLVTIVAFSDFQCPFCAKVVPTLEQIDKDYGNRVRVVFKQLPLPFHKQAKPAAIAALAAHRQGKFWEMHDWLFANQKQMRQNAGNFKAWASSGAASLGLNVRQFERDFDDPDLAKEVEEELKLAARVGARGTPNFWINGVNLRGAQPYPRFKALIDDQIEVAERVERREGASGDALYKEIVAYNEQNAPDPEPRRVKRNKPDPKVPLNKLKVGNAPVRGPANAEVTVVMFSDFQCPYCRRGADNLEQAIQSSGADVRVVYKHFPLAFHKQAKSAAKAAMAAGEQGKFWQMHDLLFENQKRIKAEEMALYRELAKKIGLDMGQFERDMKKAGYDKIIEADMDQGRDVGVRGTPAFFIDGTRLVGAQPPAKFEQVINEAAR